MCSLKILNPINISIIPPINLANFPMKAPILFPIKTPIKQTEKVIIPIQITIGIIGIFKNEKLIPTARASILVAIANMNISKLLHLEELFLSSLENII